MELFFICKYCDNKWNDRLYNEMSISRQKCGKCDSSDLKVTKKEEAFIDTYAGSPAFPEKETEEVDTSVFTSWEGYD